MTTAQEWTGRIGDAWASSWSATDLSFAGLSVPLDPAILAAAPSDGGRAVDLGCGAGVTAITLATARPDLSVKGVDVSPDLVRTAAERGEGLARLSFAVADLNRDAAAIADGADLLFSRHGVMFFDDPVRVFTALRSGVKSGARLVFSCFRPPALNPWAGTLVAAMTGVKATPPPPGYAPGPFAFADPSFVVPMLAAAGWHAEAPEAIDYDYIAGKGTHPVAAALAFFSRIGPVAGALAAAQGDDRARMLATLTGLLEQRRTGDIIAFPAAAWIWRATATEPRP